MIWYIKTKESDRERTQLFNGRPKLKQDFTAVSKNLLHFRTKKIFTDKLVLRREQACLKVFKARYITGLLNKKKNIFLLQRILFLLKCQSPDPGPLMTDTTWWLSFLHSNIYVFILGNESILGFGGRVTAEPQEPLSNPARGDSVIVFYYKCDIIC